MKKLEHKVPNLRFKDFTDDWEQRKLGELSIIKDVNHRMPKSVKNGIPYIMVSDFKDDGSIDYENAKKISESDYNSLSKKVKPILGDIIFARYASIGAVRYVNTNIQFLPSYSCEIIRMKNDVNTNFAYFVLQSPYVKNQIKLNTKTGSQPNIGKDDLSNFIIVAFPELTEQYKVTKILNIVTNFITLQQQKLDLLKQLKKGLLQKMFADKDSKRPVLRFKGFHDDWEQRKLGEVILDYKRKNNNDRLPVLTSSFQGIEYQEKHFGSQQKHDTSDYNVLPKEYMTYRNRSDNGYFRFNINNLGVTGIVSKFYPVFTTINTNKLFLASYINHNHRLKNHFKVVSVGTSQHVLSLRNFKKTNLLFPSKDEQDQIGKFFNLLNRAITLQQQKLAKYQSIKKSLLQQMFI